MGHATIVRRRPRGVKSAGAAKARPARHDLLDEARASGESTCGVLADLERDGPAGARTDGRCLEEPVPGDEEPLNHSMLPVCVEASIT